MRIYILLLTMLITHTEDPPSYVTNQPINESAGSLSVIAARCQDGKADYRDLARFALFYTSEPLMSWPEWYYYTDAWLIRPNPSTVDRVTRTESTSRELVNGVYTSKTEQVTTKTVFGIMQPHKKLQYYKPLPEPVTLQDILDGLDPNDILYKMVEGLEE